VVAPVANQTTVQGTQAGLSLSATDADGDALHYAATGLPAGLVLDGATGRITGAPAAGSIGTYSVTVSVDEGATSVVLDWADSTDSDLAGYRVYRSASPVGPFS
jgi:hypothetical protein